jgi:antitoxin HigA-1
LTITRLRWKRHGKGKPMGALMPPIHPGEILDEEFLQPLKITRYRLAKELGVPAPRISEIVHGKRRISADTALRLARYFGTSVQFWMNLQNRYDLEIERDRLANDLRRIKPFAAA